MNILAGIQVIEISNLWYIPNSLIRLFKARHNYCHISCSSKIVAVFIPEILVFNVEEQLGIIGSQMSNSESVISVSVVFHDIRRIGPRIA